MYRADVVGGPGGAASTRGQGKGELYIAKTNFEGPVYLGARMLSRARAVRSWDGPQRRFISDQVSNRIEAIHLYRDILKMARCFYWTDADGDEW